MGIWQCALAFCIGMFIAELVKSVFRVQDWQSFFGSAFTILSFTIALHFFMGD